MLIFFIPIAGYFKNQPIYINRNHHKVNKEVNLTIKFIFFPAVSVRQDLNSTQNFNNILKLFNSVTKSIKIKIVIFKTEN